jgi:hypothetical protein
MQKNADGSLSALHTRTNASGIDLLSDPRLARAWDAVRDAERATRCCLAVYADCGGTSSSSSLSSSSSSSASSSSSSSASSNKLAFLASGAGGLSELRAHLSPTTVAYGVLLARVGVVRKPVFLTWVGELCGALHRGRVSMHKQGVRNFYIGCCCEIFATDADDLSTEAATRLLCKATAEPDCSVEILEGGGEDGRQAAESAAKRQEQRESLECIAVHAAALSEAEVVAALFAVADPPDAALARVADFGRGRWYIPNSHGGSRVAVVRAGRYHSHS